MEKFDWFFLFPLYNWFMNTSANIQGSGPHGPWSEAQVPETAAVDLVQEPQQQDDANNYIDRNFERLWDPGNRRDAPHDQAHDAQNDKKRE